MIRNLVSRGPFGVAANVGIHDYRRYYGLLTSPRNGKSITDALFLGVPWAADNDAYAYWSKGKAYDCAPLLRALDRWRPYADSCLFVVAPDVLLNAAATLHNFYYWREIIHAYGFPVAFVVQNGVEQHPPPWGMFEALFIGGNNRTKYGKHTAELVQEAKRRGLHVHNGRVNSANAIAYSRDIGCDSFDGTNFTRDMQRETRRVLPHQKRRIQQRLFALEGVG